MPIRPHGRGWEVRVQHLGGRISRTFRAFKDAQEYERRHKQRIADHRVGRAPTYSLEQAVEHWLDGEAKALKSHRNLLNKVRAILPQIQGRKLIEIAEAAEEVIKAGQEAGLQIPTINRRLAVLRRVARLAHRKWKWLEHDEAGRIELLPGEEPRYVQATQDQAEKLLKAAKGRTRAAILWAASTGLRKSELQRVQPHHFQGRGLAVLRKTKTGKPRVVPLQRGLRAQDFPYGLTDSEVEKDFRQARKRAGMPWLQFRDLRRTFGSWIVQRTRSLKAAQDLLGHTTIAVTAAHYAHLLEGDLRKAINTLPNLAGLARGKQKKKKAA
jgi:integrase